MLSLLLALAFAFVPTQDSFAAVQARRDALLRSQHPEKAALLGPAPASLPQSLQSAVSDEFRTSVLACQVRDVPYERCLLLAVELQQDWRTGCRVQVQTERDEIELLAAESANLITNAFF